MLVELGLVEQRYQAVLEALSDGAPVTGVARRYGVARRCMTGCGSTLAQMSDQEWMDLSAPWIAVS